MGREEVKSRLDNFVKRKKRRRRKKKLKKNNG